MEQGCSQDATEICNRTQTVQCIYKWSGKEINNKMASAAKMNFFRTVVTKTACKELQEYFAVRNHLKIRRKKSYILCQHSIAHEGKQLLPYPPNNGLQIKHCSSGDKFLRSPSMGLVMNTCGSGEKTQTNIKLKWWEEESTKWSASLCHCPQGTPVPGSFGQPIQKRTQNWKMQRDREDRLGPFSLEIHCLLGNMIKGYKIMDGLI